MISVTVYFKCIERVLICSAVWYEACPITMNVSCVRDCWLDSVCLNSFSCPHLAPSLPKRAGVQTLNQLTENTGFENHRSMCTYSMRVCLVLFSLSQVLLSTKLLMNLTLCAERFDVSTYSIYRSECVLLQGSYCCLWIASLVTSIIFGVLTPLSLELSPCVFLNGGHLWMLWMKMSRKMRGKPRTRKVCSGRANLT